jgi:hypothetical protein
LLSSLMSFRFDWVSNVAKNFDVVVIAGAAAQLEL